MRGNCRWQPHSTGHERCRETYSLGLVAISGDRANSKLGQRSNGALGRVWEQIGNSNPEPGGCRSKMVLVKGGKVQTEQSIARYRGI